MQSRFRQMARLENTIAVLLERHRHSVARADESARRSAFHASLVNVCNLAFIILYGDPKIDEPLLFAWKRCCQSAAAIREEGPFTRLDHNTPFELFGALVVVDFFLR